MNKILTVTLVAACVLLQGCAKRGGGALEEAVAGINSLTEELMKAVESAPDPKAGLASAQALLDSRKGDVAARVAALKQDAEFQNNADSKRKWLEAEVENTDRISRLRIKYLDASMRDPEFKARLDKFVADYNTIFKTR